uniref:ATP-dependent Clp protease proteolytic subunit n=1 Tax=Passiflora lutea TaxID=330177 RepID=A0A4Y5QE27_9ROSI|nr:clp protease proteolytic subunit [Passiflora lutea]YP_009670679.1 clp protease proteolytic subunit [Passiflora lutea]QCX29914.1 clp protease proteolytic subunit [Passiflora lutea]QCX29915.1 clp protease proteolytic subunit [Passiflora lutea]
MPLGVPLVAMTFPADGDDNANMIFWIDLYDALYESKLLFLCRDIDSEATNQLIALFMYLNSKEVSTDYTLFINSPGGWVTSGMTIFNAMHAVASDVRTICLGIAASMASFLLAGGTSFKRFAFPHARVMIHQPHAHFSTDDDYDDDYGDDDDVRIDDLESLFFEVDELTAIQQTIAKIYSKKTGQPLETILADLERDFYMSATEAKAYGIIDNVVKNRKQREKK